MTTLQAESTAYADITIDWDLPAGTWDQIRLVRNISGTPRDERDGEVLFTDDFATARTTFTDDELTVGRYYYYALFTNVNGTWTSVSVTSFLTTKDWGYTAKLYRALPDYFKNTDNAPLDQVNIEPEDSFLYRFLSVFGFQLDALRTEAESLRGLTDALLINQAMLPAASMQVGVPYEPEVGHRALRHLIANAIHLWGIKGTIPGVRELAGVLTGYVTHVRIGYNLALDNLDAGPSTDKGHWHGRTNAVVTYRANNALDDNPAGEGVRVLKALAAGVTAMDMNLGNNDSNLRRRYAIPVLPDTDYVVSQYARTPGTATTGRMMLQWLDADGDPIGAAVGAAAAAIGSGTAWSRLSSGATSPSTARYLEVAMTTAALALNQTVETCGFLVQEDDTLDAYQDARLIRIYFDPQLINYIGNTSGGNGTSEGWSAGVEAVIDPDLGFFLTKFVPDPEDPSHIYPIDAFEVVVAGDAIPPDPPPEDSFAPTEMWYPDAHVAVEPGQTWTVLAEATPPIDEPVGETRFARIGFRLYDGATLVRNDMGPEVELQDGTFVTVPPHEITVPEDADYDHIEFSFISEGLCGLRHAALEQINQYGAFFFDGSQPSATSDYLWMGTPYDSPTAYYDRRSSRTVRLRALLEDYIPHGARYDITFAAPTIPDSPQSVSGVNPDPATSMPL